MRVLLIEPDTLTRQSMDLMLRSEGLVVQAAEDGEEGIDVATHYGFDAIVLSLDLTDLGGITAIRRLRLSVRTPLIALSKSSDHAPEVDALAAGADDFMRKPFHKDVLVGRLNAVVRRGGGHAEPIIRVGPMAINTLLKTVHVGELAVNLTGREFQVLEAMALRLGHTFTKEAMLDQLYGGRDEPDIKIIDVYVCKIRNKLRPVGAAQHIETAWGRGYRLVDEPTPHAWIPSQHIEPTGHQVAILKRLSAGAATFPEVWASCPHAPEGSVRAALHTLAQRGEIENVGGFRAAVYRLKAATQRSPDEGEIAA